MNWAWIPRCLNFQHYLVFQRMGHFVPRKQNISIFEKLPWMYIIFRFWKISNYIRKAFPIEWSSFLIINDAAFSNFVSFWISTLFASILSGWLRQTFSYFLSPGANVNASNLSGAFILHLQSQRRIKFFMFTEHSKEISCWILMWTKRVNQKKKSRELIDSVNSQ